MNLKNQRIKALVHSGFVVVQKVLEPEEVAGLISMFEDVPGQAVIRTRGGIYAIRNLLNVVPGIRGLATSLKLMSLVRPVLGPSAVPLRGTLFDKTPTANWKVPWHKERKPVPGFGPWSTKAGMAHVQPPVSILEQMLAVRIHLDDCTDSNPPLRVIPGSHLLGRLKPGRIRHLTTFQSVTCVVPPGGVLLMRPLLLHSSSASKSPLHRRVIHLEYSAAHLPGGLEWA